MAAAFDNMNMDMMLFEDEHDNNNHHVDHVVHVAHVAHTPCMTMNGEDALLHLSDIVNLDEMFADVMTSTTAAEQQQQQQHEEEEFNHAFTSFSVPNPLDDAIVPLVSPAATSSDMEMMMTAVPMTLPGLTIDDGSNGAIVPIAPRTAASAATTSGTKSMITSRLAASLNRTANNVSPTPSSEGLLLAATNGKKKTPASKKRKSTAGTTTATKKKRVKTTAAVKKAAVTPTTTASAHQLLLPRPTPAYTVSSSVSVSSFSSSSVTSEIDNQSTKSIKKTKKVETDGASASSGISITDADADLALKERNRVHAKASRQRRKSLTEDLHSQMQKLKEENEVLMKFILSRIEAKKKAKQQQQIEQSPTTTRHELDEIVSKKRAEPTLRFLEQFKSDPRNRKVNAKQIRFLQGLRRHLPTVNINNNGNDNVNVKPAPPLAVNKQPSPDTNKSYSDDASSSFDTYFSVVA